VVVGAAAQLGDVLDSGDPPVANDRDRVAHALHLVEIVGGEEDCHAAIAVLADHRDELLLHQRIESRCRLVEHEQLRVVEERLDQTDLLSVPAREITHTASEVSFEPLRQSGSRPEVVHPARGGAELQELAAREPRIAREVAREVAEPRSDLSARLPAVAPEYAREAARRMQQVEQRADRRRLASTVRSKEPVDLPALNRDRDLVNPTSAPVSLRQAVGFDHRGHRVVPHSSQVLYSVDRIGDTPHPGSVFIRTLTAGHGNRGYDRHCDLRSSAPASCSAEVTTRAPQARPVGSSAVALGCVAPTYPSCGDARMRPASFTTIIGECPRLCSRGARTPKPATLRQPVDDGSTESPHSALAPASRASSRRVH
jgi:hypothetical protein